MSDVIIEPLPPGRLAVIEGLAQEELEVARLLHFALRCDAPYGGAQVWQMESDGVNLTARIDAGKINLILLARAAIEALRNKVERDR